MVLPLPKGIIHESRWNPSTQGILSTIIKPKLTNTLFFLDQFKRSILNATIFSNTAIMVVRAAKVKNKKNKEQRDLQTVVDPLF